MWLYERMKAVKGLVDITNPSNFRMGRRYGMGGHSPAYFAFPEFFIDKEFKRSDVGYQSKYLENSWSNLGKTPPVMLSHYTIQVFPLIDLVRYYSLVSIGEIQEAVDIRYVMEGFYPFAGGWRKNLSNIEILEKMMNESSPKTREEIIFNLDIFAENIYLG